jgi:hypothetical protein
VRSSGIAKGCRPFPIEALVATISALRITHYKGRAIIAFAVEAEQVSIIGVFYGGQDYQGALRSESDD